MNDGIAIIYPIPLDSPECWQSFKPFVERFCYTWRKYPPLVNCQVIAVCCNGMTTAGDEIHDLFFGIPRTFMRYNGRGADIGAHQYAARELAGNPFLVCLTSRCYFHQAGWLNPLADARLRYGPHLFGCSASRQGGNLHLCTRGYCMDADDFPKDEILTRAMGAELECGENNLLRRFEAQGKHGYVVHWDTVQWQEPGYFTVPNRFRNGNQEAMLIFDKHTDEYRDASPEQKAELEIAVSP